MIIINPFTVRLFRLYRDFLNTKNSRQARLWVDMGELQSFFQLSTKSIKMMQAVSMTKGASQFHEVAQAKREVEYLNSREEMMIRRKKRRKIERFCAKFLGHYAVIIFEKKEVNSYELSSDPSGFYSVLEAGYAFGHEKSKFSFTPQVAIGIS